MKVTIEIQEGTATDALANFDDYVKSLSKNKQVEACLAANMLCWLAERIKHANPKA